MRQQASLPSRPLRLCENRLNEEADLSQRRKDAKAQLFNAGLFQSGVRSPNDEPLSGRIIFHSVTGNKKNLLPITKFSRSALFRPARRHVVWRSAGKTIWKSALW